MSAEAFHPGLKRELVAFFERNPDEELAISDVPLKFSRSREHAKNVLSEMRAEGLIETAHIVRLPARLRKGA